MHSIEQAIDEIGRIVGLPKLAFDAAGNLSLLFDGSVSVNVARIDENAMEFWTTLDAIVPRGGNGDAVLMKRLLAANHLGTETGAARLGLQPGGGAFLLCDRIEIAGLDAGTLEARLAGFVEQAFRWSAPGAAGAAVTAAEPGNAVAAIESGFAIRI